MNTKLLSALTATAAATALFGASAPAHAFSFGTSGISFSQDQDVKFNFTESHGAYISSLGIYTVKDSVASIAKTLFSETKSSDNGRANEWKGTLGNTVKDSGPVVFKFLANQIYTLGLSSTFGQWSGTVYSTSTLNSGASQQAVFGGALLGNALDTKTTKAFKSAGDYTNGVGSLFSGTVISFDDAGNGKDADFQDFTVSAEAVPEPITMTGLALGFGGLVAARRRRASKTAS
ncbi:MULTISPECIES: PEP-CTERM sorting domain-containing protein [unclassified Microcoleus]|uniref:PEP-CTERM sorting domain-containing protein n=1 Tax=unclassified Microcoleus TaxID=2642155 RepID=UPI002FD57706